MRWWILILIIMTIPFTNLLASEDENSTRDQRLIDKIEELEKQVKELTEESKARKILKITDEEKAEKEKEVLSAAGRSYTLLAKGSLELDYRFSYDYAASDSVREAFEIERTYNHTITHTLSSTYGVFDNLSLNVNLPFVYRYHKLDTVDEMDETDIGDISFSLQFQPMKSEKGSYAAIFNFSVVTPTGRSPYKINTETELSTGSGLFSYQAGMNISKSIDPLIVFGSINYSYRQTLTGLDQQFSGSILEKVEPGDSVTVGIGYAYSLSYRVSFNQQFQYSFAYGSKYSFAGATAESPSRSSATLLFGTGWKVSSKTSFYINLGIGLTRDDPDFTLSVRVPFEFIL
ncbi:MAG: hypothetical protein JXM72_12590 [Deltaproteobacteria bacterium]|nr:hypothetical protein [Deltaproteobacteria bacterium]